MEAPVRPPTPSNLPPRANMPIPPTPEPTPPDPLSNLKNFAIVGVAAVLGYFLWR